jgi:hypothetical protein
LFHLAEDAAMTSDPAIWPSLDFTQWRDTALTLQLWMQVVGKTRLALTPWLNHSWQVPFYVTARGLGTSLIPSTREAIDMEFDFIQHRLIGRSSRGVVAEIALRPMPVAEFYSSTRQLLQKLGVAVEINPLPSELPDPVAFGTTRNCAPMIPMRRIVSGGRCCRPTACSNISGPDFWARQARCICSGAASIWR